MGKDLYDKALNRLNDLIAEGWSRDLLEVNAAALATADSAALPSVRMVNIVAVEAAGLLFFVNQNSGKGQQLRENPHASLCFFWPQLFEQVIIEGAVRHEDTKVSDQYWKEVSRERQVYTWVTAETPSSQKRGQLRDAVEENWHLSSYTQINRPEHWHACRLVPERIEFWPSGWRRAQERELYTRDESGSWRVELVNP